MTTQTQPKFTRGPWHVVLRGERGTFYIPKAASHEAANADDGVDGYTISSANRNLIAAAPEMYGALMSLRSFMWSEGYADQTEQMAKADAAIAKAEGK